MPNNTWGSLTLNLQSIQCSSLVTQCEEKQIIPDPTTYQQTPSSILIGCGYKRARYTVAGWVDITDFVTLYGFVKAQAYQLLTLYVGSTPIEENEKFYGTNFNFNLKVGSEKVYYTLELVAGNSL